MPARRLHFCFAALFYLRDVHNTSIAPNKVQDDSPHTAIILSSIQKILQCCAAVTGSGAPLQDKAWQRSQAPENLDSTRCSHLYSLLNSKNESYLG